MLPKILSNKLETTTLNLNRTHLDCLSGSAAETYIHKIQENSSWYKWIKHRTAAKSLLLLSMTNPFLCCCPFEIYWVVLLFTLTFPSHMV